MTAPVYPRFCAPQHLKTRRQLAALGLRPNGQQPAGYVPWRFRGVEGLAVLFDVRLAAPKLPASPARLAACAKATREHQIRAAERHGISRAELEQIGDPGPGWADAA